MARESLITILEVQLQLLEEFLNLLSREAREMSAIHLDAMAEINSLKEGIVSRIEVHSALVRKEIAEAAGREGLSPGATLGELAAKYKQKGQKDITRLHKELNRVSMHIRQAISVNIEIAERFAASVTSTLGLLARVINQSNTYGASGGYQQRVSGAVLINREA